MTLIINANNVDIKNKAVSMAWDWQQFSFSYMNRFGNWPRERKRCPLSCG